MHWDGMGRALAMTPLAGASNGCWPQLRAEIPTGSACRMVAHMVRELTMALAGDLTLRRGRRRQIVHMRQITFYVCHVALRIPLEEIGAAFRRDRATVERSCHLVEDRRDDAGYDDFVCLAERLAAAVLGTEAPAHD